MRWAPCSILISAPSMSALIKSGGSLPNMSSSVTLDDMFGNDPPDFIKADIEGAEMRMLQGAQRILAHGRCVFLLEIHPWADPVAEASAGDVRTYFRSWGYWPVSFYE